MKISSSPLHAPFILPLYTSRHRPIFGNGHGDGLKSMIGAKHAGLICTFRFNAEVHSTLSLSDPFHGGAIQL